MKAIGLLLISMLILNTSYAQTTYTWNAVSGDWTVAANWTPTRTTPATNDILVFNGSTTPNATATNIPRQTIGKLRFINNVNARLVAAARATGVGTISRASTTVTGSGTAFLTDLQEGDLMFDLATSLYGEVFNITSNTSLTTSGTGTLTNVAYTIASSLNVGDGTLTAVDVTAGSTLTMGNSGAEPLVLRVLTGSKANIEGLVRMLYARQRIVGADSASVLVKSGGVIRTDSSFVGNPFLLVGGQNRVIFEPGSNFEFYTGSNPFALTVPLSKIVFMPNSNYWHLGSNAPSVSGRTYANFRYNFSGTVNITLNGTIDSLMVLQGTPTFISSTTTNIKYLSVASGTTRFNITAGSLNLLGNLVIGSGSTLNLLGKFAVSPANLCFRGTTQQTISGSGNLRIAVTADSAVRFRIQNNAGVLLQRNLDLNAAILDLDSGSLLLNGNTVTVGSSTPALHGRATQLNGVVRGTGVLSRWYSASANSFGDSSIFPVGSATATYPVWVAGTPSTAGLVSLTSFTENSGVTNIAPTFNDAAPHGVIVVNQRLNHAWTLTSTGLAGSNFSVRLSSPVANGWLLDTLAMRVTLTNGAAPGTSADGSGTLTRPMATKTGLTAADLNNTFYLATATNLNPLPVRFIAINGKQQGKTNQIEWTTASEINLSHFEVEKKLLNEEEYQVIGMVKATNGNRTMNYVFMDNDGGSATYRIKAVDYDGSVNFSKEVALVVAEDGITLSPNPVLDVVTVAASNKLAISRIEVYNAMGKQVPVQVNGNKVLVDALISGVYYLHAITIDGVKVVKFVKH
ncbi:MAG: T9SS C-terminal target domain-containing protein [Bacteroidetes bacterium]|nr:MAG: T9SS C-terminal target domain-containing protein [Bacteroidota bacterium]